MRDKIYYRSTYNMLYALGFLYYKWVVPTVKSWQPSLIDMPALWRRSHLKGESDHPITPLPVVRVLLVQILCGHILSKNDNTTVWKQKFSFWKKIKTFDNVPKLMVFYGNLENSGPLTRLEHGSIRNLW